MKKLISLVLCFIFVLTLVPFSALNVNAATYNLLFPVNNGGKIAYIYGYSEAYGGTHDGIDIHANGDDTIYAATDGVVGATANSCTHVSCGYACEHYSTYGNYIRINNTDGTKAYYGHLLKDSLLVKVGDSVTKGQPIATMGSSGYSTGKHLHFELRSGDTKINVNPVANGGAIYYQTTGYNSTTSQTGGIQQLLNKIKAVYPDQYKYFTASGNACYDAGGDDCYIQNIPARGGLPSGKEVYNMGAGGGWSCNGFARYVFGYIFGKNFKACSTVSTPSVGDALWTTSSYGDHYSIYLGEDSNNWYVFDSNFGLDCSVRYYGALSKSKHTLKYIYHASNYNEINGSSTEPTITYENIANGAYYLKSNYNGEYLSVAGGKDANKTNVNTWPFAISTEFIMHFTKASQGYKLRPECCSSRLINSYGTTVSSGNNVNIWDDTNESSEWWGFQKVSGGYVVRNMMNPSCVLTVESNGNIIVSTYTGATTQIWTLQNTIEYNANGGSGAPSYQIKNYGSSIALSSTKPTRSGHTFLGWSTNSSATSASYSAGASFSSNANTRLYAVWGKNYTISYNANGGSGAPSSQTKTHGVTLTLSSTKPTRSGYTFLGWATSSSATSPTYSAGGSYTADASTTLYAVWKANTYTISYNANGGSSAPSSQTKTHGVTLTLSSTKPTRIGYTFLGWATSSSATSPTYSAGGSYTANASTTLYAVWKANSYTIFYNANGGSGSVDSITVATGGNFTLPTSGFAREGYTLDGFTVKRSDNKWYVENKGWLTESEIATNGYAKKLYRGTNYGMDSSWVVGLGDSSYFTFYANWKANTYTVSYNANGGSGAPSSQTKTHGVTLTLSSTKPTRTGYTFLGWSTSSSATSADYSASASFTTNANTTLYAVWEYNEENNNQNTDIPVPAPEPKPDPEPDTDSEFMLGDVNDSKEIDSMDYVLVKRAYFGTFEFNEAQLKAADVNASGDIDSMDYVLIKRAYFGTFSFQ